MNAFIYILAIFVLTITPTFSRQLTFVNEEESSVKLKDKVWKDGRKLQFKLLANGDDGTVMTAKTQSRDRLQLGYESGMLKLRLNDQVHHIPGLTDRHLDTQGWHDVSIEQADMGLEIGLNGAMVLLPLYRRKQWLIHNWNEVYLGLHKDEAVDKKKKSFVGCVELMHNATTHENNVDVNIDNLIDERVAVLNQCVDACSIQSCKNGAKCINNFNHATCDCQGTGFQGVLCDQEAPTAHFNGAAMIAYDTSNNPYMNLHESVSMRFKTDQKEGLLLVANFDQDFLRVKLQHGAIHASARFGRGTIHMKAGKDLNDNMWHFMTLSYKNKHMELQIDNKVAVKALLTTSSADVINMVGGEELVYFGGIKTDKIDVTSSIKNFKGCLQQVSFNGHDVINKVLYDDDWKFTTHGKLTECVSND